MLEGIPYIMLFKILEKYPKNYLNVYKNHCVYILLKYLHT